MDTAHLYSTYIVLYISTVITEAYELKRLFLVSHKSQDKNMIETPASLGFRRGWVSAFKDSSRFMV